MRQSLVALAILAALAPLAATEAEAKLWDLLIDADVTADVSYGANMTVAGSVTEHAGWPVPGAAITLRVGSHAVESTTGRDGAFEVTVDKVDMIPGLYAAHMRASTEDGRVGMSSIHITVTGDVSPSAHTARLLASAHAMRYLAADVSDFEHDPIGAKIYEYYQKLQKKLITERAIEMATQERREELARVQDMADAQRVKMLEREARGDTELDGYVHGTNLDSITDNSTRTIIASQFDRTLEAHKTGKEAMRTVLDRGGTMAEALAAYNAAAAIPRNVIENDVPTVEFDINDYPWAAAHMSNSTAGAGTAEAGGDEGAPGAAHNATRAEVEPRNTTRAPGTEAAANVEVGTGVTTLYMSIDGELVRHVFNGTHWVAAQ